jgi:hypothetical protein
MAIAAHLALLFVLWWGGPVLALACVLYVLAWPGCL